MKIKSIENFSLEECREYLNMYPNGPERFTVEDRLNAILQQKKHCEEQKDIQKKLEQKYFEKDVSWIDIKQFLANHKYHNLSRIVTVVWILLVSAILLLALAFYYSNTDHTIFVYGWKQAQYTSGIERLLLEIDFIDTRWHYTDAEYPRYETYDMDHLSPISLVVIIAAIFILIIINSFHSPSLPNIYNIEKEEKTKSIRRTQNRSGKFGLHLCKKLKIIQLLPMEYDNIYYCGGNAYVCVKGTKSGVYNVLAKKMVINIEYNTIELDRNGALLVSKNGVNSKLTTDGYRIIE